MATEKLSGIVTEIIKHSDRHNVVTLFTRDHGRMAFLSSAGNGKTSRSRNALLMPLSWISADVNIKPNKELHFLGRFQPEQLWKDLYFNPVKSAIALFISEFVNSYTRNSGPDPALWDYVRDAVRHLDQAKGKTANFHIAFLIGFMDYAGIRPDLSQWREDAWFDMRGGTMSLFQPMHRDTLPPSEAKDLPLLARMTLRNCGKFKMNSHQRKLLLREILRYYSIHFPGTGNLRSPAILAEVFG